MLLPDKNETHFRVFQKLSTLLLHRTPVLAMAVFERAAINALQVQWPNIMVSGCFFNLNQNIWRKIQELGLAAWYGENLENSVHLKMIAAVAFVPPEEVFQSWDDLLLILHDWMQPFMKI